MFENILKLKTDNSGNDFDEEIINILSKEFTFISSQDWKKLYPQHQKVVTKDSFDFTNLPDIPDVIIDKPNGSQRWPDMLIIKNNKALPIEIKSGNGDKIMWNSSLPKDGCVYVFNNHKKKDITIFLGEHIITPEHRLHLENYTKELKDLAKKFKTTNTFNPYGRIAYESNEKYTSHPDRITREQETLKYIKEFMC